MFIWNLAAGPCAFQGASCAVQHEGRELKTDRIVVKKYENRRLYDTSASRYVNLDELAIMIRRGADVQVLDAKTGEDITRVALAQIIMEDAKGQPTGLPLELLRQLIVASDQARQDFMLWYLKAAFDTYGKEQDAIQSQLSSARSAAVAPLENMRRFFAGPTPTGPAGSEAELGELRKRVAELEAQLHSKKRPAERKRPKSSKARDA